MYLETGSTGQDQDWLHGRDRVFIEYIDDKWIPLPVLALGPASAGHAKQRFLPLILGPNPSM